MSVQLTVSASATAARLGAVPEVIASLPVSLSPATREGDLVAVAGGEDWTSELQRSSTGGARGLMVVDAPAADVRVLRRTAATSGVPVVVDGTWTHDPAVAVGAPEFGRLAGPGSLVRSRVAAPPASDARAALIEHLSLISCAVARITSLRIVRWDRHGYGVLAELVGGAHLSADAVLSSALPPSAQVRVVAAQGTCELRVGDPSSAAPGSVVVTDQGGRRLLPTLWESSHRAAWRRLHQLVVEGSTCDDLDRLAEVVDLVDATLGDTDVEAPRGRA